MNAVFHCSDVELGVWKKWGIMVFSVYCNIGPFLMHSSDKVLLNPYTQSKVLSMVLSNRICSITASWLMTMAEW